MKFSELKIFYKENYGIKQLTDIAKDLDVSPQAINNWKIRDQVPHKIALKIREEHKDRALTQNSRTKNNYTNQQLSYSDDGFTFLELYDIIKKNIHIIIIIPTILCTFAIIKALFFMESIYTSSSSLLPINSESSISKVSGIASQFGFSIPGVKNNVKMVYPEIIKSRTLAKKMLFKKFNTKKFGKNQTLLKLIMHRNERAPVGLDTLILNGMNEFIKMVNVEDNPQNGIVTISVDSYEPELANDILRALINELDLHQKQFKTEQIVKKRIFIEERIKDIYKSLLTLEESVKNFRIQNRKYIESPTLLLEFERLMRETEVQKQLYITLKSELEMTQIREVEKSDIFHILDEPEIPLKRSRPNKKRYVLLAGFLGIGLGLFISFTREWYYLHFKK